MKKYIDIGVIITILLALCSIIYGYGFLNGQVQENKKKSDYHQQCIDNMYEKINRIDSGVSEIKGYIKGKQNRNRE